MRLQRYDFIGKFADCMDWIRAIEIFAVVSGIIYILLEIGQKSVMCMLGILTSAACAFSFFS